MKRLIIFCLFILCTSSVLAFTAGEVITIQEEDLPVSDTAILTLLSNTNSTLVINQTSVSNETINVSSPEKVFFNISNEETADFNYSVGAITVTDDFNLTYEYDIIAEDGETTTYGLVFEIIAEVAEIEVNSVFNVSVAPNGYYVNVSEDLLPLEGTLDFTIVSDFDEVLNITNCHYLLSCQDNFSATTSEATLEISYSLPSNLSLGETISYFNLTGANSTREANITFNVVSADIVFEEYTFSDDCLDSEDNYLACLEEKQQQELDYVTQYFALRKEAEGELTIINETEVLVMVGSIDAELKSLYDECREQLTSMEDNYLLCTDDREDLYNDKEIFDDRLTAMQETVDNKAADLNATYSALDVEQKQKKKQRRWGFLFSVVLLSIIGTYYFFDKKYNDY